MSIRTQTEEIERQSLHPKACLSAKSIGRVRTEKEGDIRTCFQRDRDRIIHSKAFRRLKHKTQVFLAPKGDHYRTRLTHVLEVSQIGRTIARALRLNEDLTEAIALAHDLGHTPFGHAGEAVLREIHPGGFEHHEQSLRVVDFLERDGKGLNLTNEVRDGILKHSKGKGNILPKTDEERAITLEGQVVRVSDTIAYLSHDLDDSIRAQVIKKAEIPPGVTKVLGDNYSDRIDRMVKDIIYETVKSQSLLQDTLKMSEGVITAMYLLRDFLFERVYENDRTKREFRKAHKILSDLYDYYLDHIDEVFSNIPVEKKANPHRVVCDFIAGMTDRFALRRYEELFMPGEWLVY